ncbi:hypothetical protein Tco_0966620 [Tanacetum coccineum]
MTRSSTNKLFTPYKEPEREFRSTRRHFKTLSLDELRSPDFNLLSDQEYSEEQEAEAMAKTMEQYMSKTRTDYDRESLGLKLITTINLNQKANFLRNFEKTHLAVRIMRMRMNKLRKFSKLLTYSMGNQGDDLMPTIKEGEVIEEFRTRNEDLDTRIDDYPSYCDDDKKIHIDCAHNLKFSCMIGFEFTHANFFPLLYVNVMKDKMVYKGNNIVGALMNIPIFVGTFSVMTDFAILEDMDAYRDEGMGDIIVGEPFLREVGIKTKRFEGIITLYKSDDEVTYQMVRSHPRFKNHNNEQCNKIPPLLKESKRDENNGISHAYQKLKGFYKGVLNLGPDYIRDAKMEEWLIRWHISVHEME